MLNKTYDITFVKLLLDTVVLRTISLKKKIVSYYRSTVSTNAVATQL